MKTASGRWGEYAEVHMLRCVCLGDVVFDDDDDVHGACTWC